MSSFAYSEENRLRAELMPCLEQFHHQAFLLGASGLPQRQCRLQLLQTVSHGALAGSLQSH